MTDHPEYMGLMADVLASPEDDTPRRVLADWFTDHGDPERGRYIHLSIDHHLAVSEAGRECLSGSQQRRGGCACRLCGMRREIKRILRTDTPGASPRGRAWVGTLCRLLPACDFSYSRGFVAFVRCSMGEWDAHGAALVAEYPIDTVSISDRAPYPPHVTVISRRVFWANPDVPGSGDYVSPALPWDFFLALDGWDNRNGQGGDKVRWYADQGLAQDALSRACLSVANGRAGRV